MGRPRINFPRKPRAPRPPRKSNAATPKLSLPTSDGRRRRGVNEGTLKLRKRMQSYADIVRDTGSLSVAMVVDLYEFTPQRAYNDLVRFFKDHPDLKATYDKQTKTFTAAAPMMAPVPEQLSKAYDIPVRKLSTRERMRLALDHVRDNGWISAKRIVEIANCSQSSAENDMRNLLVHHKELGLALDLNTGRYNAASPGALADPAALDAALAVHRGPPLSAPDGSGYTARTPEQAKRLVALGATPSEVADFFGVDPVTVHNWSLRYEEFANAIRVGRTHADERVTRALYGRAIGGPHKTQKAFMYKGAPVIVEYVETLPPDTAAAIFWLKNRRPDQWRDIQRHEHTMEPFRGLSDAELIERMQQEARLLGMPAPAAMADGLGAGGSVGDVDDVYTGGPEAVYDAAGVADGMQEDTPE